MSQPLEAPPGSVIRVLVPAADPSAAQLAYPGTSPLTDSGVHRAFLLPATTTEGTTPGPPQHGRAAGPDPVDRRTWATRVVVWLLLLVVGMALVCYPMGPLFESRAQSARTDELRLAVGEAYGAAHNSLAGALPETRAPLAGSAVGLLQLPRLAAQQAVAESADPETLRGGAGHVPGTAALGQPGNSVVVARAAAFGGPFSDLGSLRMGDQVLVVTTQGQSVYVVSQVSRGPVTDSVYDPTSDNRLTLLTSGSVLPWNGRTGVVVVATMSGSPYTPTPQNGYTPGADGRHADLSAWPLFVLELLAMLGALAGVLFAYRHWTRRMAYLVTTPMLVALVVFLALTGSRLFPGWA